MKPGLLFEEHAQVMAAESRLDGRVPPLSGAAFGGPCAFENVSIRRRETRTVLRGSRKALKTILILISAVSLLATLGAAQPQSSDTATDSRTSGGSANGPTTIATYPVGTIL